jgi:5-methylcytosine-specific restriction endonuclease McrA
MKYRFKFLLWNRNCYCCGARATVVDHLIPHKGSKELFEQTTNHIPMCEICHNTITGLFDKKVNKENAQELVNKKAEYITEQRKARNLTSKIRILPSYR